MDIKLIYGNRPAPALSLTGLQALALGVKVINFEYQILNKFPSQHDPYNVVKELDSIYKNKN